MGSTDPLVPNYKWAHGSQVQNRRGNNQQDINPKQRVAAHASIPPVPPYLRFPDTPIPRCPDSSMPQCCPSCTAFWPHMLHRPIIASLISAPLTTLNKKEANLNEYDLRPAFIYKIYIIYALFGKLK